MRRLDASDRIAQSPGLALVGTPMIARSWSARASPEGAANYADFFRRVLSPQLGAIEGHRGGLVLERSLGADEREITVLTFWEDMAAVSRFAGPAPERAVVEPEAQAMLTSFDLKVRHHRILLGEPAIRWRDDAP